jgi:hypothetical protein
MHVWRDLPSQKIILSTAVARERSGQSALWQMERCFEPPVIVATLLVGPALPPHASEGWRAVADHGQRRRPADLAHVRGGGCGHGSPSRATGAGGWPSTPLDVAIIILAPPVVSGLLTSLLLLRLLRPVRPLCVATLAPRAFSLARVRLPR